MMQEAFVYCWTDHKTNMLYVGYHKGSQGDGYVCSSKWLLEEYKKRPEDFTRMILAEGTIDDCLALETSILKSIDAKHNPEYYNQHNGDGKFVTKYHTEETIKKLRKPHTLDWNQKISAAKMGYEVKVSTRALISEKNKGKRCWEGSRKGQNNPFYGRRHSKVTIKEMSDKAIGRPVLPEIAKKISETKKGKSWSAARRRAYELKYQTINHHPQKLNNIEPN